MAPGGLVISKLALQASVDEELLKGLLCMKISIPKDVDTSLAKLPLFPETSPQFLSHHLALPLPLSPAHLASRPIYTASILLGLSSDHANSHPHHNTSPTPTSSSRVQVQIETTRPEGPVYIAVQGGKRRRPSTGSNGSGTLVGGGGTGGMGGARREYLVCMQVEHDIQRRGNMMSIQLPLPKCLDNNLRLHILPRRAGPSGYEEGDVSLMSEPRILPLPSDAFDALRDMPVAGRDKGGRRDSGSCADSETSGSEANMTDEDEDVGSWVEGRFQGTDRLKLEWTYVPSAPTPHLHLAPDLASRSIGFVYDTQLSSGNAGQQVPVNMSLPAGWGISELSVQAHGLASYNCLDDDALSAFRLVHLEADTDDSIADDSFTTILAGSGRGSSRSSDPGGQGSMHGRPVRSSASLMHQTLPAGDSLRMDEYSFEMGDQSREAALAPSSRPGTPMMNASLASKGTAGRQSLSGHGDRYRENEGDRGALSVRLPRGQAVVANELMVHFDAGADGEAASIVITGTLIPLRQTLLISSSAPTPIPVLSVGNDAQRAFDLTYGHSPDSPSYVDPADQTPVVDWRDARGHSLPPARHAGVSSLINRVSRDAWGKQSATVEFAWKGDGEVILQLPRAEASDGSGVRVVAASAGGRALQHAVVQTEEGLAVVLGSGVSGVTPRGTARVCLESADTDRVLLVHCPEATEGDMQVELLYANWPDISRAETNIHPRASTPQTWTYPLSSSTPPYLLLPSPLRTPASSTKSTSTWRTGKGLWSWSTLINIFLLYLLLSLAQQVQRLRHEVGFVKNEYGDLRQYASVRFEPERETKTEGPARQEQEVSQGGPSDPTYAYNGSVKSHESAVTNGGQAVASPFPGQSQHDEFTKRRSEDHAAFNDISASSEVPNEHYHSPSMAQPTEGLPRYDWQGRGTARMQGEMPGYQHVDGRVGVHGRGGADPMGVGRVVVGQSTWDKLAAHPTIRTIEQSLKWMWGTFVWLLHPGH